MIAYDAMMFARKVHFGQSRKYTGNPYTDHLAEVAGIVATVYQNNLGLDFEEVIATAWLHDCMEDCGITYDELRNKFNINIANSVLMLSDLETGNRSNRKKLSRDRLSSASYWVQTIKCADLISNTSSIVKHDPKFAKVYLNEKRLLLDVLTNSDERLLNLAKHQIINES